jgi:hypothetical protein
MKRYWDVSALIDALHTLVFAKHEDSWEIDHEHFSVAE